MMIVDAPFVSLSLKALHESPTNPRRVFESKPMSELVDSVREHGVLQPILVREHGRGAKDHPEPTYEIVAGARRFRAARQAGLLEVPCIVRALTDKQTLEVQFIENLQREGLHPLDEGYGYKRLHDDHGYSVEQLAAKLGKSMAYVYGRMQLAKLPVKAQTLFLEGKIDLSHAQLITRIPVPELADKAAHDIAKGDFHAKPMVYRDAVEYVRRNYQCNLKTAPFSTRDKSLVEQAGACGDCPKRSGNQKDLFGGADGVGADICTDPNCFESKVRAAFNRSKTEVLASGGKVLQGKKAESARWSTSEFVDPKSTCYEDPKRRKYEQLVKGQVIKPVLIEGRDGEAMVRWTRSDIEKAIKENGHKFARQSSITRSPHEVRQEKAHKERLATIASALPGLVQKAEQADPAIAWRFILEHGLTRVDGHKRAQKRRGVIPALVDMSASQLQGLAVEVVAAELASSTYSSTFSKSWLTACKVFGVAVRKPPKATKAKPKAGKAKKPGKARADETPVIDVNAGAMTGRGGSPRTGD